MNYPWKKNFSDLILNRGKNYFREGRVKEIYNFNSGCSATVLGSEKYNVVIKFSGEKFSANCDCPFSGNCKHIAATLFALEEKGLLQKSNSSKTTTIESDKEDGKLFSNEEGDVFPFENYICEDDDFIFFDMEKMTETFSFKKSVVDNAKKIVEQNCLTLKSADFSSEESKVVYAADYNGNAGKIEMEFIGQRIYFINCDVQGNEFFLECRPWKKQPVPSALVTAALLLLGKKIKEENPIDLTDEEGKRVLEFFGRRGAENKSPQNSENVPFQRSQEISFAPLVEPFGKRLEASFKIGVNKKLYAAKNISNIVEAYNLKSVLQLGKNCSIDFSRDKFDERSQKYFEIAKAIVNDENAKKKASNYYSYFGSNNVADKIALYGKWLDSFFDIVFSTEEKRVQCKDKSELVFAVGLPQIELDLKAQKDSHEKIAALHCFGMLPDCIRGEREIYFVDKRKILRAQNEFSEGINFIYSLANPYNEIEISFGRKSMAHFMHEVLPQLEKFCAIKTDESEIADLSKIILPKPNFKFYFDSEDGKVFCRAEVFYGEKEFNAADLIFHDKIESVRDFQSERRACDLLCEFFESDNENEKLFSNDEEKIFFLLSDDIQRFTELGEVNASENFSRLKIRRKTKINFGVSLKTNLLDLEISADEMEQEELLAILSGMKNKKKYVRLTNGDFVDTHDESLEELYAMFDTLKISPKEFVKGKISLPAYRALYLNKMLESNTGIYSQRDNFFKSLVKEFKTVDDSEFELPSSLEQKMRPYQKFGFKWLCALSAYSFGGILADDMGLGKTLQAISLLLAKKESGESGVSLVVCPASLVFNWAEEFKKFAPQLNVKTIAGGSRERTEQIAKWNEADVLVTSYDLLKRDIEEYDGKDFLYQIIDEAQFIKNHLTAAAKSVKVISARHRIALTGTPIENRLSELWSIFDFLMPGFLFSYEDFKKRFEIPIVKDNDASAAASLRRMALPFILRRIKTDVLKDLPEKIEEVHYARFEPEQKKLYDAHAVKIKKMLKEKNEGEFREAKIQVLAELTKIRQVCCDPHLLYENYSGQSAKREACIDLIKSGIEGEHKMLLFSQFTSMLELLENDLRNEGIEFFKITGETPKQQRLLLVEKFNSDSTPVFLISLKAGGTGLNLTGADIVIHYDPWWNLAVQNQATDRAHRIGQEKVVSVFKLIAKDTIEEKIMEMQNSKKDLADQILSGEGQSLASMSKEEILSLL